MKKLFRWFDRGASLLSGLAAILAIAMSLLVFLASIMRYVFGAPFDFTQELVGLLFTAMIFTGLPICTWRRSHISVTIVPDLLSGSARRFVDRLAYLLLFGFCVWFGLLSLRNLETTVAIGARTAGSRLTLWPWVAVLPVSCFLSALAALLRIVAPDVGRTQSDRVHRGAQ